MVSTTRSVRQAEEQDAARLAEIHIAAWQATYRGVMSDEYLDGMDIEHATTNWRRNIVDPRKGTEHLVVVVDDQPAGFAILGPAPGDFGPGVGQPYAINMHPDWWAQGLGSTLLAAAEQKLIELGFISAFLWVEKGNSRAISFYNKHGWLHDGGTLEDTRFDPPVSELRHKREFVGEATRLS